MLRVPPTGEIGTSTPAPAELVCPSFAFDCAFSSPRRGGRLSRCVRFSVDVCFAVLNGFLARSGATRAAKPPKTERGAFRLSKLAEKLHPCQSIASRLAIARGIFARFSAFGGRRPLHNERRTLRARSTGDLPRNSARAGFAYSRANGKTGGAVTGTANAGRENRSPRWWGHRQEKIPHVLRGRGAARSVFGGAAIRKPLAAAWGEGRVGGRG